ncbi:MAG TPA: glucoamylase family protein [Candidatus Sulfotelmatobacter sp.]|nr:glucoamylase family protein [Candidatus Sulfotelmatobacter sp.]
MRDGKTSVRDGWPPLFSRRQVLRLLGTTASLPLASVLARAGLQRTPAAAPSPAPGPKGSPITTLSPEDDQFLNEVESASFQFFWEQGSPNTGMVKDRCNLHNPNQVSAASIAATGFGLTALCIADQRKFVPAGAALERVFATLRFLWRKLPNHRGFFFHFAHPETGERMFDSEVSSVDTAILMCGVISCREHFRHPAVAQLANLILNRVDWSWLAEDTALLTHGWTPEVGFLSSRWDYYSELMMMYLLAMGAAVRPLSADIWNAWKRLTFEYDGMRYIGSFAPLFVHQYSQAWFDFRYKRDKYADYFQNSVTATEVHRRFCLELRQQFPDYSEELWGITASDSSHGYVVWGGPPAMGPIDGTVVPSAAGGSLPFLPAETMRVLKTMRTKYPSSWTKYGFVDAFNPLKNWYDSDVIGIDTGIILLMAENLRTGFVWDTFMRSAEAKRGMDKAGFQKQG